MTASPTLRIDTRRPLLAPIPDRDRCTLSFTCPVPLYLPDGSRVLVVQGGYTDAPNGRESRMSLDRTVDKLFLCEVNTRMAGDRNDYYGPPVEIFGRRSQTFPWMPDRELLERQGWRCFVSSVAGPSFIWIDGVLHCFFSGCVADPELTTGEHTNPSAFNGNGIEPWSYFAIFHSVSYDEGRTWTLRNHHRPNANEALSWAAVFYEPDAREITSGSFKGLAMTHGIVLIDGWYYLYAELWGTHCLKNLVFRTKNMSAFQVYDTFVSAFVNISPISGGGELPRWVNGTDSRFPDPLNDGHRGDSIANMFSYVAETKLHPDYQYIAVHQWGRNNQIAVSWSRDAISFSDPEIVQSSTPGFADGTGSENQVINPRIVEDGKGGYEFWFSSHIEACTENPSPYVGMVPWAAGPVEQVATAARRRAVAHA